MGGGVYVGRVAEGDVITCSIGFGADCLAGYRSGTADMRLYVADVVDGPERCLNTFGMW